jgi:hypothetical protein
MPTSRLATVGLVALLACAGAAQAEEDVGDGAPISPEFAQTLFGRVGPLREADGCRLARFDTSRYRITVTLVTPAGAEHFFDLATAQGLVPQARTAGEWAIAVPAPLARDCPTTVAAIERILVGTSAPTDGGHVGSVALSRWHYVMLAATFLLLLVGTVHVLYREAASTRVPRIAAVLLVLLWAAALGLRLWVSPRTFLHEYYHIAETVPAYLSGELAPGYGKTGPALFRLVGRMLGDGEDLRIIFVTNAVLSSLAVPAAAMLVLGVIGSWSQALCAGLLLTVLPQHLRFSAAEDLFVQATTFSLWALALFACYQRTRRLEDALLGVFAASLATQSRPDMILFPGVMVAFFVCVQPRAWRVLFAWPTFVAGVVFAILLVPHAFEVVQVMREARSPAAHLPDVRQYVDGLVLLDPHITPIVYPLLIVAGAAWAAVRRPGWLLWIVCVYVGFTMFAHSIFDNPPWRLRSQTLPNSYLVLLAGGAASVWIAAWRRHRQLGAVLGTTLLLGSAIGIVGRWHGFVGELKDQQLEWAFLERHVAELPAQATLLTAVETGGYNLDAFPEFLLRRSGRRYALVDLRRAAAGTVTWPTPTGELLYYQGMFCYFAVADEPAPETMTPACRAVHERYTATPIQVEDLHTEGYSMLRYAQGGRGVYRIGFYRLTPRT